MSRRYLALGLAGGSAGGPAKVAVVSSALLGTMLLLGQGNLTLTLILTMFASLILGMGNYSGLMAPKSPSSRQCLASYQTRWGYRRAGNSLDGCGLGMANIPCQTTKVVSYIE
ncbi:MAG: hypothetical protein DDT35_01052 [Firmicutes bacterium]|nr:hypothetical protein [Bacillota bacterium]